MSRRAPVPLAALTPWGQLRAGRRPRRLVQLVAGLTLYGVSVAMMVRGGLGLPPWDVLTVGLVKHLPMSFGQVVESALGFARDGFPAYQLLHRTIGSPDRLANLHKYPDSARVYLPNGKPPALGSLFTQPDLARTLTLMVEAEQLALGQGQARAAALQAARDVFYKGDVARRMVQALQALGGLYTYEDFAEYPSPLEEPLSTTYRGYELFTNSTWTQGITLLQALNILEGYDLTVLGHNSAQAIHLQVEALKLAFADRERYVGDPTLRCSS